jgi:hypothetical protein
MNVLFSSLITNNIIKIYVTISCAVVLYGCETVSNPLSEECRLRVFKNGVLRRIKEGRGNRGVKKIHN